MYGCAFCALAPAPACSAMKSRPPAKADAANPDNDDRDRPFHDMLSDENRASFIRPPPSRQYVKRAFTKISLAPAAGSPNFVSRSPRNTNAPSDSSVASQTAQAICGNSTAVNFGSSSPTCGTLNAPKKPDQQLIREQFKVAADDQVVADARFAAIVVERHLVAGVALLAGAELVDEPVDVLKVRVEVLVPRIVDAGGQLEKRRRRGSPYRAETRAP